MKSDDVPSEIIESLASSEDWRLRQAIAWSPSEPESTLTRLKEDEDDDMGDFIVDDDVANEPFTYADPDNDFVRETHQAVHDYNKWDPKNNSEKNDFVGLGG